MTSALFAVGGCYLATALGLAGLRRPARILLAVAGLCSIGIAASPEPAAGSTPQHLAWTALGAATITVRVMAAVQTSWPSIVALAMRHATAGSQLEPSAPPVTAAGSPPGLPAQLAHS